MVLLQQAREEITMDENKVTTCGPLTNEELRNGKGSDEEETVVSNEG